MIQQHSGRGWQSTGLIEVVTVIVALKACSILHLYVCYRIDIRDGEAADTTGSFQSRLVAYYDGRHYLDISRNGYDFVAGPSEFPTYAFFPLFPAVLRTIGCAEAESNSRQATVIIVLNCLLSLVGGVLIFKELEAYYHREVGLLAIILMFASPLGCYFEMAYTESLYLFLIGLVYTLKSSVKGVAGFLSGLTRPQGILVAVLCGAESGKRRNSQKALLYLSPLLGFMSYAGYVALQTGRPLAVVTVQQEWGRFSTDEAVISTGTYLDLIYFGCGLVCCVVGWKLLRRNDWWFLVLSIGLPVITGSLLSFGRFCLVIYPLYVVLGMMIVRVKKRGWIVVPLFSMCVIIRAIVNNAIIKGIFVG